MIGKLTRNFRFIEQIDSGNFQFKAKIVDELEQIEIQLRNESRQIDFNILKRCRDVYEYIILQIGIIKNISGRDASDIYHKFINMWSNDLSSTQRLAFDTVYKISCFGSHANKSPLESNKVQDFTVLQTLYGLWILLKLLVNDLLKKNEKIDEFDKSMYMGQEKSVSIISKEAINKENIESIKIKEEIDIQLRSVATLLKQDVQYIVPIYQRGYSWEESHINTFLNDVEKVSNDNNTHYFGVMAAKKIISKDFFDNKNRIKIIDGQQRLTTSMLFLCACRDIISNVYKKDWRNNKILFEFFNREKIQDFFYNPGGTQLLNDSFRGILLEHANRQDKSKYSVNYWIMYDRLSTKKDNDKINLFLSSFAQNFKIGSISFDKDTFSNKNEMEIFQNINSKGKSLTSFELIKNYIFSLCSEKVLAEQDFRIQNFFATKTIYKLIESDREKIDDFFESLIHYYNGIEVSSKEKEKNMLFEFQTLVEKHFIFGKKELSLDEYETFIKKISYYFNIWQSVMQLSGSHQYDWLNKLKIKHIIDLLPKSKRTSIFPLLYLFADMNDIPENIDKWEITLTRQNKISNQIMELIKPLIKYALIKGQGNSEINRIYYRIINESIRYIKDSNLDTNIEKIISNLNAETGTIDNLKYQLSNISKWSYAHTIALSMLEWKLWNYPNSGEGHLREKASIEHIMPQNFESKWKIDIIKWNSLNEANWKDEANKYLNRIGNYLLLSRSLNSTIQDSEFIGKNKVLRGVANTSPLYLNLNNIKIDVSAKKEWTFKIIDERSEEIIKLLCEVFK